ncbi:helix-turn-helix domain-containing protein [Brevibacillus centrosporus]|uniref:DNA-binding transcriptional regulator, XRE family n=1 Tax=Brevibacillus centrosporus TaxID=54910 RepID=A0A1I3WHZ9_9BACL|nr:helix-turn-helix transcriptional regulator [Brevibacillus centrosporus]MED4907451.1 helix-turn-helix transcriptional regulator [Brevibacillus centrosporus]SFK07062.1 DNA-binding transcriptional regulator, XRE family [Brevibacillus centrosporus]
MALEWRLRQVMAERGVWTGAELIRLMEDKAGYSLSAPSISVLLANAPKQVKADTMDALCTALDCSPSDLWRHKPTYINRRVETAATIKTKVSNDRLPPI